MKPRRNARSPEAARFRVRLLVAMMLVVSSVAAVVLPNRPLQIAAESMYRFSSGRDTSSSLARSEPSLG